MENVANALAVAFGHHEAGRLRQAADIYEAILATYADYAPAWYYLGLAHAQGGELETAAERLERAIQIQPDWVEAQTALGNVWKDLGRLDLARICLQRAAELLPTSAEAHYNLGNVQHELGEPDEAIACFRRAIELRSDFVEAYSNLGVALEQQGELNDAIACFSQALALRPGHVAAQINLGNAYRAAGRLDEAIATYSRLLELRPDSADAFYNLGLAFQDHGRHDEAVTAYQRAIELNPHLVQAFNNLGNALREQGNVSQAVLYYRRALELAPNIAETHNNLGSAWDELERLDEAIACFQRALQLRPDYAEAYNNLGGVLKRQCRLDEAVACHRRALELSPEDALMHSNFSLALLDYGQIDDAEAACRRALRIRPDSAHAHYCHSLISLLKGDLARGFAEHEQRWQSSEWLRYCKEFAVRDFGRPRWKGEPLVGRTILLHAEQGLGDTLQFVRYASLVKRRGARVVVECQPPLVKLLARCSDVDHLVARGDRLKTFDVHAPLVSLPAIFRTTLTSIPAEVPYLSADPTLIALWRERLAAHGGLRIGINWKGRSGKGVFQQRDIPLEVFAALAGAPGVRLISLQKGEHGRRQLAALNALVGTAHPTVVDLGEDFDTVHGAFMDTAAIMMNLDLVITSDTSIAHLAGGLGVPVWVGLPIVPDWRWLLDRTDSPWYPTMRLFRQQRRGDWAGVFREIEAALRERLDGALSRRSPHSGPLA